eukprot:s772_g30.t1
MCLCSEPLFDRLSKQHPFLQDSLQQIGELNHPGLQPNFIIYSAAIAACEKGEEWQMALHLLSLISTVDSIATQQNRCLFQWTEMALEFVAADFQLRARAAS